MSGGKPAATAATSAPVGFAGAAEGKGLCLLRAANSNWPAVGTCEVPAARVNGAGLIGTT